MANLTVVSSEKIFKLSPESEKPESWLSGDDERDDSLEDKSGDVVDDALLVTATDLGVETADGVDIVLVDCRRRDRIASVRGDNDNLDGSGHGEDGVDVSLNDWLARTGNLPPLSWSVTT